MISVKKIDIHAHAVAFPEFYPPFYGRGGQRYLSADELIAFYDELNIEKGVLLPISSCEGQPSPMTSEGCAYLAKQHPDRFLWFCGVDPRTGAHSEKTDLSYFLNHYKSLGALGLGELTAQLKTDDPMMENLFAHCAACKMPVLIHIATQHGGMYGIEDDLGLPRLEKMMKKYPDLIVIGHSQAFWAEMSGDLTEETRGGYPRGKVTSEGRIYEMMRSCPNLYCDLSAGSGMNALRRDTENAAKFIEEFSDRILYGCDICGTKNKHQYEFDAFLTKMVEDGLMSEENYRKIVRTNAIRLLGLDLEQ